MKFKEYLKNEETLGGDIAVPDIKIGDEADICPITGKPRKKKKKDKKTKMQRRLS